MEVDVQFQEIQLRFLRDDLVDMWGEQRVGIRDLGADGALDGGFDFALRAGGDACSPP